MSVALENALWASIAAGVSVWAMFYSPRLMRFVFGACAALAVFYAGAYLWLAFNLDRQGEWSRFIIHFGRFSWICSWIAVPAGYVVSQKRTARRILREASSHRREVEP